MVNFSILNSKSITFETEHLFKEKFKDTLDLLKELKGRHHLDTVRTIKRLGETEIIKGKTWGEVIASEQDVDFRIFLKSFLANKIIEYPIVSDEEDEELGLQEYQYAGEEAKDMGYADIFETLLISFNSDKIWDRGKLNLKKIIITTDGELQESTEEIYHASTIANLNENHFFINERDEEIIQAFLENFEDSSRRYLSKIKICPEVFKQVKKLDRIVLRDAVNILYSLETGKKTLQDYSYSSESDGVKNDPTLKELRKFRLPSGESMYMFNHIKNLAYQNRIHFYKQSDSEIYIGYIGKHLQTVNY